MKVLLLVCIALIGAASAGIIHPAPLLHGHVVGLHPVVHHTAVVGHVVHPVVGVHHHGLIGHGLHHGVVHGVHHGVVLG